MGIKQLVYFLNPLLMIAMPVALARLIKARRNPAWELFGIGAATFVISQVAHIPFNFLVLNRFELISLDTSRLPNLLLLALFLGLSAGLFEESARYLTLRFWAVKARSWGQGLMLGAGHGGIEAMIVGTVVAVNYLLLARMRGGALLSTIPENQLPLVTAQIEALFSAPWHLILLGAAERLFALCFHLAAALLVLEAVNTGKGRWYLAAVGWHTLLNATAVIAIELTDAYVTELFLGVLAALSLVIIFRLKRPEPVTSEPGALPPLLPHVPETIEVTPEALEKSRYY